MKKKDLLDRNFRPEILRLTRIHDTSEDRFDYLRMDKNECLHRFDEKLLQKFKDSIDFESISAYPELDPLYRKLAAAVDAQPEQIFLAAGSDIAIRSIYEACVAKGDNVVLSVPSYAMFRVYAWMLGADPKMIPLKSDWNIDVDAMLNSIDDRTKLLAIENPNGSTGTKPSFKEIERIASETYEKGVLFAIDEVYFYVDGDKSRNQSLLEKYPNTIIIRSFSKSHGLAGLRIGYLLGDKDIIEPVSRVRPMHEITSLAAAALNWSLDNPEILASIQNSIRKSKDYLSEAFAYFGIKSKVDGGNFILAYMPNEGRTKNISERLADKKILIRRPFDESFLKGWTRVTVPELEESKTFIKSLKELLQQ
jgi:histidinol-phosphate aminotransferase